MIRLFNDLESLSRAAADLFADLADQAITLHGRFSVALSGGQTPSRLYEILAGEPFKDQIHWDFVQVFWADERCVPPDDPRSNFRMARETLLDHVPLPVENIHPIQGDLAPAEAAAQYESVLRNYFEDRPPVFDLILLGMGSNAHIASLFPHTPVLDEKKHWVAEVHVPGQDMDRVTLTPPIINLAGQIIFLVSGAEKSLALQRVLEGAYQPSELPAQLVRTRGVSPIWLVDREAGRKLTLPDEMDSAD